MANEFGDLIRNRRKKMGWTQARLAEQLNTTQVAISDWENGRNLPRDLPLVLRTLKITETDAKKAIHARYQDDDVIVALANTTNVSAEARDALLTLYREAVLAHKLKGNEE